MNVISKTLSNNTLTVLVRDDAGKITMHPATSEHPQWAFIKSAWERNDDNGLLELLSMKRIVEKFTDGNLIVSDQGVFYCSMPLSGVDVDRLMAFLNQGLPYEPIAKYMVRKFKNPSKRAIEEMYNFLEHKNMPLTPEGTIIAYKGVQQDFFSVTGGKEPLTQGRRNEAGQIFNGIGETIEMDRCWVDDNFKVGCSGGLHAGSLSYAKDWARQHNGIIILIEIDPANVVSVPEDCNCKKLRCSKYKVIGLYDGPLPDSYTEDFSVLTPVGSDVETDDVEAEKYDRCGEEECSCDECPECGYDSDECECDADPDRDEFVPFVPAEPVSIPAPIAEVQNLEVTTPPVVLPPAPEPVLTEDIKLRQQVVAVIAEQLCVDPLKVNDDSHIFDDLGADSLDGVELCMAFEEEFGIEIPDENAEKCRTVGDMIRELRAMLGQPSAIDKAALNASYGQIGTPTPAPTTVQQPPIPTSASSNDYQAGYDLGRRNGTRRRKRIYRVGDENRSDCGNPEYVRGYNAGYLCGRWDYVRKG